MSLAADIAVAVLDEAWLAAVPDAVERCRKAAAAALAAHGAPVAGELTVALADDAMLRRLNREHRGQDKPTNVLAFPLAEPGDDPALPVLLGDVVIARETVLREARDQGKSAADHLTHLVVHGTLHVLGHDHDGEAEAARMEALETRVLAGLGIADPYRAVPAGDAARGAA
ncbi:MAG TPA: rRNA maturation RNase YbeY [Alphaproteobacteria bacterium]|jgi:probable rRNA maturation factor|nr:rRNA maturation RNase YbeY [Alphaproteobacteria bacterium]